MKSLKIGCVLLMIFVIFCFSSCDDGLKGGGSGGGKISDKDNANSLRYAVIDCLKGIYDDLLTNYTFNGYIYNGNEGTAKVTGDKVQNSYSWGELTYRCDIDLVFDNFSNTGQLKIFSGTGTYTYYRSTNMAGGGYSESFKLNNCPFEFKNNGKTYTGTITSGNYSHTGAYNWNVSFTFDNGETVSLDWLD